MTRGHPPYVAIGEAMRRARSEGLLVLALEPAGTLPFHFVTVAGSRICLNRVRRLKLPGYSVAEIEHSCRDDIALMRSITVTPEILRILWVRGPDRRWYRYRVLPDRVKEIKEKEGGGESDHEKNKPEAMTAVLVGNETITVKK